VKRIKALVGHRWRAVVAAGLVVALGLALLPAGVLAYHNPSAELGWGPHKQAAKHGQPAALDVEEDEETEAPDPADAPAVTSTRPITNAVRLRGPITELPKADEESEASPIGEWVVAGQAVQVTAETKMSARADRAAVGDWAQVWAQREDDELVALKVTVMHANKLTRVVGVIEEIGDEAWVVAGMTVSVTAQTKIVGTPAAGATADVRGAVDDEGAFLADKILVRGTGGGQQRERDRIRKENPGVGKQRQEEEQEGDTAEDGRQGRGKPASPGQGRGRK
jgi:hypothetical protein